jgi:hypothetical protein
MYSHLDFQRSSLPRLPAVSYDAPEPWYRCENKVLFRLVTSAHRFDLALEPSA